MVDMDPIKFKILIIGDTNVGKTSLLIRSQDGVFRPETKNTVGIDFTQKTYMEDSKRYDLAIWDTAGQERFRSVTKAYYRDAHAAFLVFDVTSPESLEHIRTWHASLMSNLKECSNNAKPIVLLIGNKNDYKSKVKQEDINKIVEELQIPIYISTSAKTGEHVEDMFRSLLGLLISNDHLHTGHGSSLRIKNDSLGIVSHGNRCC